MDTIVVCAVLQDAAPGILEWIAFHRLIGVDRFVLYDLGGAGESAALVARSRFARQVTVIDWSRDGGAAMAHADFVAHHATRFTWAALIALDEFIHPLETDTIRSLLPRYDGFPAVVLRRLTFATVGRQSRPGQFVIGSYTGRILGAAPLNAAAPTLLRTADLQGRGDTPFAVAQGGTMCNARGEPVSTPDQACDDVMVVNRYPIGAAADGWPTVPTGLATSARFAPAPLPGASIGQQLPAAEAPATIPDRRIMRFIPRLRAMLHDGSLTAEPRPVTPVAAAPPPAAAATPPAPAPVPPAAAPSMQSTAAGHSAAAGSAAYAGAPSLTLGIGIVTYNRQSVLSDTLDRVQRHTRHPRTIVAVADDGSTDGTLDMLRARQVLTVTGRNTGIAWNKNRALFLLAELARCDVVILLEDDAYPSRDNWEAEWIQAAIRWGHANLAAAWLREQFLSGTGTVEDPILAHRLTAQCAVFSREALLFGGYFDTRFRGYGHEHVEHTWRLLRMGYGGIEWSPNANVPPQFKLLWGGISHHDVASASEALEWQTDQNRVLAQLLLGEYGYRAPFRNEEEAKQLRDEMRRSFPRAML